MNMAKSKKSDKKRCTAKDGHTIASRDPNSAYKGEELQ